MAIDNFDSKGTESFFENSAEGDWAISSPFGLTDKWPKGEGGEHIKPVFLAHRSSVNMEAEMTVNLLAAYDVPCIQGYPSDGAFGKIILGMSGAGVDIYVPETLLEDAKAILEGNSEDNV